MFDVDTKSVIIVTWFLTHALVNIFTYYTPPLLLSDFPAAFPVVSIYF